jgi:type I restriction enzyme S subunit
VRAPVGDVNIADINYCIGRGLASLSIYEGDNKFLYYVLFFLKNKLEKKGVGSTFKAIDKSTLNNFIVPYPPLETQQKIVTILEKAEATKKFRAQADVLTNQLLQNVFLEMFGDPIKNKKKWDVKQLDAVCLKVTDGEHNIPPRSKTGIPLLMATNVRDGYIDLSNVSYISEEDHQKSKKRCNPEKGDILLVCVGATIGRLAIVPKMDEFSLVRSVALLKPNNNKIMPQYLLQILRTKAIQSRLLSRRNTSAQSGLYLKEIKKIKIPVPPIQLQKKFSEIVEHIKKTQQNQLQSRQEIDYLINALMQKIFTGDLVA